MKLLPSLVALSLMATAATARRAPPAPAAPPADDGIPIGTLPRQTLAAGECGIFLWKAGDNGRLLLMAKADPPRARIVIDGQVLDLPRTAAGEGGEQGMPPTTTYSDGSTSVMLELSFEHSAGLTQGATIPAGTLRVDRANGLGVVVPVAGLLGCR